MRLFIVPPDIGWGWRIIATGARGLGAGAKRPSRRPSGPGKMTSGIVSCSFSRRGAGVALKVARYIGSRPQHAIGTSRTHRESAYLSRSCRDHAALAGGARGDGRRSRALGQSVVATCRGARGQGDAGKGADANRRGLWLVRRGLVHQRVERGAGDRADAVGGGAAAGERG